MPCQLVEILARLRVKPKNPPDLSVGSVFLSAAVSPISGYFFDRNHP